MKTWLLCFVLLGCSSASEPIGETQQPWANTCQIDWSYPDLTDCANVEGWECKDGERGIASIPALGWEALGTWCRHAENGQTYYYVCGINDKNQAWVYCDYPGETLPDYWRPIQADSRMTP